MRPCSCCRRPSDPGRGGFAAVLKGAELARAGRHRDVRHPPDDAGDGIRLHRMRRGGGRRTFTAKAFVEKPPLARARDFVAGGTHVWNSGMFASRRRRSSRPASAMPPRSPPRGVRRGKGWPRERATRCSRSTPRPSRRAPNVSIDYAVMEKAAADGAVAVVRGDFDWSDVGSWQAVSELTDADAHGNRGSGERVAIDTHGTFIHSEDRVVATIGVSDLVIVDTPDAVLVAHRDHLQRVKEVVGELKAPRPRRVQAAQDGGAPLGHVHGSGGRAALQDQAHRGQARRLAVAAAASSSQRALGGGARDSAASPVGESVFDLPHGESTYIPMETMHRLENRGTRCSRSSKSHAATTSRRTTSCASTTSTAGQPPSASRIPPWRCLQGGASGSRAPASRSAWRTSPCGRSAAGGVTT